MPRPSPVLMLFMALLLPDAAPASGLSRCASALGYGRIDQNAPAVREAGLYPDDPAAHHSMICGPVCLISIAMKALVSTPSPVKDPVAELRRLLEGSILATTTTIDAIRNEGMMTYDLAALARDYFARSGVLAVVSARGTEVSAGSAAMANQFHERTPILPGHLRAGPGEFIILNYESWRAVDLDRYDPGDAGRGWVNGHYVVLTGFSGPTHIGNQSFYDGWIIDPVGGITGRVSLKPVRSRHLAIDTFEIRPKFPRRLSGAKGAPTNLVTNIIKIKIL